MREGQIMSSYTDNLAPFSSLLMPTDKGGLAPTPQPDHHCRSTTTSAYLQANRSLPHINKLIPQVATPPLKPPGGA